LYGIFVAEDLYASLYSIICKAKQSVRLDPSDGGLHVAVDGDISSLDLVPFGFVSLRGSRRHQ